MSKKEKVKEMADHIYKAARELLELPALMLVLELGVKSADDCWLKFENRIFE